MIVHGGDEQIADHLEGFGGSVGESFKTLYEGPMRFADDEIVMKLRSGTQWDALSHVWYDHKLYNGYPAPPSPAWEPPKTESRRWQSVARW